MKILLVTVVSLHWDIKIRVVFYSMILWSFPLIVDKNNQAYLFKKTLDKGRQPWSIWQTTNNKLWRNRLKILTLHHDFSFQDNRSNEREVFGRASLLWAPVSGTMEEAWCQPWLLLVQKLQELIYSKVQYH